MIPGHLKKKQQRTKKKQRTKKQQQKNNKKKQKTKKETKEKQQKKKPKKKQKKKQKKQQKTKKQQKQQKKASQCPYHCACQLQEIEEDVCPYLPVLPPLLHRELRGVRGWTLQDPCRVSMCPLSPSLLFLLVSQGEGLYQLVDQ